MTSPEKKKNPKAFCEEYLQMNKFLYGNSQTLLALYTKGIVSSW